MFTVSWPLTHMKLIPYDWVAKCRPTSPLHQPTCKPSKYKMCFFSSVYLITCEFKVAEQIWQPLCPHCTGFGRVKQYFFPSSALQSVVKIYSSLMEWAGRRSAGLLHRLEKTWGLGQWLSALFVYGHCCVGAEGQTRQRDTAVPWACGPWRATSLQRPPALRDALSLWWKPPSWAGKDRGGYIVLFCPLIPPNMLQYSWMKNNLFKTLFTLAVIRV